MNRSITAPFYRRNAGFFLFIFFLLFGLQPGFKQTLEFHYVMIEGISTSINFYFIALIIWVLYTLKVIHFYNGCIKNKSYKFLQNINASNPTNRFYQLFLMQLQLLFPVLFYGLAAIVVAFINNHLRGGVAVTFTLISLSFITTSVIYFLLQKSKRKEMGISIPSFRLSNNLFTFLLKFIFNEQFIILLILKTITFSCLYFFVKTDSQVFEERMLWLLYITSLIGHCIIVYRNYKFIETKMSFYRNLPVKPFQTLISLFGVYFILLIPEIWALKGFAIQQGDVINYLWMILTGPTLLLLLHCLLYTDDMKMEGFLQLLFGVWIVSVFISLSSWHWLLPSIFLFMAIIIFFTSYHGFEKNTEVEGLE